MGDLYHHQRIANAAEVFHAIVDYCDHLCMSLA